MSSSSTFLHHICQILSDFFQVKDTEPLLPREKISRSQLNRKYGHITLIGSIGFILAIAVVQTFFINGSKRQPPRIIRRVVVRCPRWLWVTIMSLILAWVSLAEVPNLLILTKRLGRISAACLPLILLLTMKPSPLPHTYYMNLLPIHKWLSRIVVLTSVLHSVFYFYIYWQKGKLMKLTKWPMIFGIIATVFFLIITLTSIFSFRRKNYRLFYMLHYTLSWSCVGLIYYHAKPPVNGFTYLCLGVFVGQVIYRVYKTRHMHLQIEWISSSLMLITIPGNTLGPYEIGSHLRISDPLYNPLTWIQSSHPYTIASLPEDNEIRLLVRKTRYHLCKENLSAAASYRRTFAVFGAFEAIPSCIQTPGVVKRALFVTGGSGIATCAPMMRFFAKRNVPIKLIWAIRNLQDIRALEVLEIPCDTSVDVDIEIYSTGEKASRVVLNGKTTTATAAATETEVTATAIRPPSNNNNNKSLSDDSYSSFSSTLHSSLSSTFVKSQPWPVVANSHGFNPAEDRHNSTASVKTYVSTNNVIDDAAIEETYENETHRQNNEPMIPINDNDEEDQNFDLDIEEICCGECRPLLWSSNSASNAGIPISINGSKDASAYGYQITLYHQRPVLNKALQAWLTDAREAVDRPCGVAPGVPCCMDNPGLDRQSAYVFASGPMTMVKETEGWANTNGFSFFHEEFSM